MSVVTATVLSGGKAIDPTFQLLSVGTFYELNRIPYAELVFIDGNASKQQFAISNAQVFALGKEIEIKLRYEDKSGSEKTVFKGLVVTHGVSLEDKSSILTVLIKDKAVILTQVKSHRIFAKMSDAEIIKKIIGLNKLSPGTIGQTQPQYAEIMQYACSDWDFMLARAKCSGLLLKVQDSKISAELIKAPSNPKATINYGIDLVYSFDIEANGLGQYDKISGVAWDSKKQQIISVNKSGNLNLTPGNLKSQQFAQSLGGQEYPLATSAQLSQAELTTWAQGQLAINQLNLIKGRISIVGRTDIALLDSIEIKGIGERFNGKALVTGLSHRVVAGDWITDIQFGISDTFYDTLNPSASGLLPGISGLHIGLVLALDEDPDKELRVKVKLPMLKADANTLWARLAAPDAGKGRGFYFRPEINDEVVIGFVNDDPRQAIILGSLFSSKNSMPTRFGKPGDKNNGRGFASKKGMVIGFDDEKNLIYLETPGKNSITLDDKGKKIEIKDQNGNTVLMDKSGITIKSAKDFTLEASGKVSIKGSKVDIK